MGFMETLFGGPEKVTLPPAIKAEIAQLQYIPFGPERDALVNRITQTYGISSDLIDTELQGLGQQLTQSEGIYGDVGKGLSGIANMQQQYGGRDPYMEFYGNPAAREASYLKALQEANMAAFDPYGSQGSESQMRQGLISANQAQRGITNSGIARRQEEQEMLRMASARQEADSKALQQVRQQGIQEAGAFNAAKGIASQNLGQAAQTQNMRANVAGMAPQQRMDAAKLYGSTAMDTAGVIGAAQTEDRVGQQNVQNYNVANQNKVNQDYTSTQNQRNIAQGNFDASRQKIGLLPAIGQVMGMAGQIGSMFGGMGKATTIPKAAQAMGAAGSAMGDSYGGSSNWNPQMYSTPSIYEGSRYGAQSSYNPWNTNQGGW
jgi:uncharacterized membrane protein